MAASCTTGVPDRNGGRVVLLLVEGALVVLGDDVAVLVDQEHAVQVPVLVQIDSGDELVVEVETEEVPVPERVGGRARDEAGDERGEPVPTSSVWMAVEEKAVARATMLTTALVTSSCRSCALSARMAEVVLPYLAALSNRGTLRPTPITNVITSWMPIVSGLVTSSFARSVVAR